MLDVSKSWIFENLSHTWGLKMSKLVYIFKIELGTLMRLLDCVRLLVMSWTETWYFSQFIWHWLGDVVDFPFQGPRGGGKAYRPIMFTKDAGRGREVCWNAFYVDICEVWNYFYQIVVVFYPILDKGYFENSKQIFIVDLTVNFCLGYFCW